MRRRTFIAALGGAAAWPMVARAQQPERVRRIGVLMSSAAGEPDGQARLTGFLQGLQEFGWTASRNVRIEYRLGSRRGRPPQIRGGISRSHARRHYGFDQRERIRIAAGKQHCAHRICIGH